MSSGSSSFSWFSMPIHQPWSGAVTQDIATTVIRGDWETESEILRKEGLGRQLGIISEALAELVRIVAASTPEARERMSAVASGPERKNPFEDLQGLVQRVGEIKAGNREAALRTAESAIDRAARLAPDRAAELAQRLNARSSR